MKILDRIINFIFSLMMIVISTTILLGLFNLADVQFINNLLNDYLWNQEYKIIVLVVASLVWLAAIKTTIFLAEFNKNKKEPIIVNSENGSIRIAVETIESTAKAVAKLYDEVKDINVKMVNKKKGIDLYMSISVIQDTNIKDLTKKIQEGVKAKIQSTTGVEVLNTDIKVKNVVGKTKDVALKVEPAVETISKDENVATKEIFEEPTIVEEVPMDDTFEYSDIEDAEQEIKE